MCWTGSGPEISPSPPVTSTYRINFLDIPRVLVQYYGHKRNYPKICAMKKSSKLDKAINTFRKAGGLLTMSEALAIGIHRRELYALRDKGDLEVVARGLYRLATTPELSLPDFIPIAKKAPQSVICLISALAYHEISTQIPHFVYVALPSKAHKPKISHPPMRYFWYTETLLTTGVETHTVDSCTFKIFNIEKTLVDCIKFRSKIGMDVVLEAFKMYWKKGKTNLDKLLEYAKVFRVEKILKPILEAIAHE